MIITHSLHFLKRTTRSADNSSKILALFAEEFHASKQNKSSENISSTTLLSFKPHTSAWGNFSYTYNINRIKEDFKEFLYK